MEQKQTRIPPLVLDIALAMVIFAAVLTPRILGLGVFVTADEGQWLNSSVKVAQALHSRQWAETFQLPHPGVPITLIGASSIIRNNPEIAASPDELPTLYDASLEDWSVDQFGVGLLGLLIDARRWITIAVSFLFALSFFPLLSLVGRWPALFAILFVAWSPMSIAFSRQLQPDGTLAALCFASLAYYFAWLFGRLGRWSLLLSGVLMGLALLTKVPAVVLLLAGVLMAAWEWRPWQRERFDAQTKTPTVYAAAQPRPTLSSQIALLTLWIIAAIVTFFAWPALWTAPLSTLRAIVSTMVEYSGGHVNPNYFMGRVGGDPGLLFYPVALLFRITPATAIGLIAALFTSRSSSSILRITVVRKTAGGFVSSSFSTFCS